MWVTDHTVADWRNHDSFPATVTIDVSAWLATFVAAAVGTASVLLGAWGIWLLVDPHEERHFEYAVPALLLAVVGAVTASLAWRHGRTI